MRLTGLLALFAFGLVLSAGAAEEKAKLDPAKLVGTWSFVSGEVDGNKRSADDLKADSVVITRETLTLKGTAGTFVIKYKLHADKTPCRIDMEITKGPMGEGAKSEGIIELKEGRLKLCYPAMGGEAPKDFSAKQGSGLHYFVLKKK